MVMTSTGIPGEIKVFLNHIYEYKKEYATWFYVH